MRQNPAGSGKSTHRKLSRLITVQPENHFFHQWFKVAFDLTFPQYQYTPSIGFQLSFVLAVIFNVGVELLEPKLSVCRWCGTVPAPLVSMPIASMNKNDSLVFGKYNIGLSRQILHVLAIAIATGKQIFPNSNFYLRIFSADSGHIPASFIL